MQNMDDEMIVSLYWAKDKSTITETSSKYGELWYHFACVHTIIYIFHMYNYLLSIFYIFTFLFYICTYL